MQSGNGLDWTMKCCKRFVVLILVFDLEFGVLLMRDGFRMALLL